MKNRLLAIVLFAALGVVFTIAVTDAESVDRLYKKPLQKLSDKQLRREQTHSRFFIRFIQNSPIGKYDSAFRHRTCFTVAKHRRGLCFYLRNRVRYHQRIINAVDALMQPPLPPHYNQWLCIHSNEGAWDANTGNGFYGGLQMDWSFMRTYGPAYLRTKGTADNWTPLEQMWVAERAYSSGRGFGPWPNTARACGLL